MRESWSMISKELQNHNEVSSLLFQEGMKTGLYTRQKLEYMLIYITQKW